MACTRAGTPTARSMSTMAEAKNSQTGLAGGDDYYAAIGIENLPAAGNTTR